MTPSPITLRLAALPRRVHRVLTAEERETVRARWPASLAQPYAEDTAARRFVADHPMGASTDVVAAALGCKPCDVRVIVETALRRARFAAARLGLREWTR